MSYIYAFFMGIIQGLTEFLPVSSSGHLIIFNMLFGEGENNLFFDVVLHFGTLVSVFVAFWKDIWELICSFFGIFPPLFRKEKLELDAGRNFVLMLIVSLLPLFIVLPIHDKIESLFSAPIVVGFALIVTAVLLYLADRFSTGHKTNAKGATWKDALFVGISQLIATIPGLSRSGTTTTAGLYRGYSREFAVKFSFIMSIPTILAAFLLELFKCYDTIDPALFGQYLIGFLAAMVVGYLAIWLVRYIARAGRFSVFSLYCLAMGVFTITWSLLSRA